jgi:hypothetical protein
MAYSTAEARQQLLDDIGAAVEEIGVALAALTEAYDHLDERMADRMEEELFRPVQVAYGRARRTHTAFAERVGLPTRTFEPSAYGRPTASSREMLDTAVEAIAESDHLLTEVQDSMMPVEVGDPELRAGLAEVRGLVGPLAGRAREITRVLGR